ncbi:MAG: ATP-binding protein, partial [Bacteroidaceae bacterium]|nr:ATP-binding protein [Bacteroidaceae bacterium]
LHIGETLNTKTPVFFYPNNTNLVSHPNLGIIGTMGTGKTQFARSIIAQFSKESIHNLNHTPIGMLVFDYKGDYNDEEFLSVVNGESFDSTYPFNPLKLVLTDKVMNLNLPSITADRIANSMKAAFGLGDVQYMTIKEAIVNAYKDFGITKDPTTWGKMPPTMDYIVTKYLEEHESRDKVYTIFRTLDDYQIFTTNQNECVSLFEWLKSVKVIDLTLYADNVKKLIVSLILDLFYAEMKQLRGSEQKDGYRELRSMILVDEAHQFMRMRFDSLRRIISEGRMFGVGMILSTQNLSDFRTDEDYSSFIKSWIVHNVNNPTKSDLAAIFGNTESNLDNYASFLNKAKVFESICKLGNFVTTIRDLPFFQLMQEDPRFK